MTCSYCEVTDRLTNTFWCFWYRAATRLSKVLIATVIVGGLAAAAYFNVETRKLESQLSELAGAHLDAETENRRLRRRTLALWKERARVTHHVARIEAANAKTDARVRKLKHRDSVARAEVAALCGEIRAIKRRLAGACKQRDLYRDQLKACVTCPPECVILRPVTQ